MIMSHSQVAVSSHYRDSAIVIIYNMEHNKNRFEPLFAISYPVLEGPRLQPGAGQGATGAARYTWPMFINDASIVVLAWRPRPATRRIVTSLTWRVSGRSSYAGFYDLLGLGTRNLLCSGASGIGLSTHTNQEPSKGNNCRNGSI
ncbi:hypothetical protein RRG08_001259 [Elysia crispata]|uniref:Uncharacterized protein n=1 Tax=Elysia crispata TaxID=231223 RepID=A0AAE1EB07_9GAST|nr:hypothetical protein RRG08_001259 [Elysia crispata]